MLFRLNYEWPGQEFGGIDARQIYKLRSAAASATGHPDIDHLRILNLVEAALGFAVEVLAPGGSFLSKVLQGGGENALVAEMRKHFTTVRRIKPPSSRADSAEFFLVGTGFKGPAPSA